jgi:hypothetical protein
MAAHHAEMSAHMQANQASAAQHALALADLQANFEKSGAALELERAKCNAQNKKQHEKVQNRLRGRKENLNVVLERMKQENTEEACAVGVDLKALENRLDVNQTAVHNQHEELRRHAIAGDAKLVQLGVQVDQRASALEKNELAVNALRADVLRLAAVAAAAKKQLELANKRNEILEDQVAAGNYVRDVQALFPKVDSSLHPDLQAAMATLRYQVPEQVHTKVAEKPRQPGRFGQLNRQLQEREKLSQHNSNDLLTF